MASRPPQQPAHQDPRAALADAKVIVVKIGSRSIMADEGARFQSMADQVMALRARGHTVIVVSSGAIALGFGRLGFDKRPKSIPHLQASAAVGQSALIRAYEEAFAKYQVPVAQVLLTHAGMTDRERYLNARAALDALLERGAVPIINENDTVSIDEIKFGDNDQLAAMVSTLVGADLLVLLTDVDGLLDADGKRVSVVRDLNEARALVRPDKSEVSLGGMASKLQAAERAVTRGLPMLIAPASDASILTKIVRGDDVGTLFLAGELPMASRKHWIAYTLKARGVLVVDDGAANAVTLLNRSLLAVGVQSVRGEFRAGDAVSVEASDGKEIARGLSQYDSRDLVKIVGKRSQQIEALLGHTVGDAVVHRDDLVVL